MMKTYEIPNQLDAMKEQITTFSQKKVTGRVIRNSSGGRLPAVKNYEHIVGEYNSFLEKLGIKLRMKAEVKFEKNEFNKCNRYMGHQLLRIRKYKKENPRLAGRIAASCIKRSKSFRMSAFNHIFPQGYFALSESEVFSINRKVEKLTRTESTDLDYKRVYIPKPNGKMRPLGVPSNEGRVYLHMGNNMLVELLGHEMGKDQHAYLPGKGVKTAGQSLIMKINKYKYVYETDLKNFFNEVNNRLSSKIMERNGVPKQYIYFFENLNLSQPKLREKDEANEGDYREREEFLNARMRGVPLDQTTLGKRILQDIPMELLYEFMVEDECESLDEGIQLQGSLFDSFGIEKFGNLFHGVPQGTNISPFLATLPLQEYYLHQAEHVSYADDHIFFGNEPFEIKDNKEEGIIHAEEKCRGIKGDGELTEEGIKFLGYRLKKNEKFSSETRTGTSEEMNEEIKKLMSTKGIKLLEVSKDPKEFSELFKEYSKFSGEDDKYLEKLAKRNIFGFVLNALNTKDWENGKVFENSRKAIRNALNKVHKKSGLKMAPNRIHSSTSMYALSYIVARCMKSK